MIRKTYLLKTLMVLCTVGLITLLLLSRYMAIQPALAEQEQKSLNSQKWEYCSIVSLALGRGGWTAQIVYFHESGDQTEDVKDSGIYGGRAFAKLGADGWELVGVSNEVTSQGNQTFTKYLFKRAK